MDKDTVIQMFIAITLLVFMTMQIRSCELERARIESVGACFMVLMNAERCQELIDSIEE